MGIAPVAKGSDGKLYVGDPSTPAGGQPKPAVLQLREKAQSGQIPGMVSFQDTPEYLAGVIAGFAEGGWSLITGTVEMVATGVMNQFKYSVIPLGVRWLSGDEFQSERQQFFEGFENLKTIGRVIEKVSQGEAATIDALLSGDEQEINTLSGSTKVAMEMSVELFAQLMLEIDDLPDYDKGKIVGRAIFEIAAVVAPLTKLGQVRKLAVLEKLKTIEFFQGEGPAARALAKLGSVTTRGSFLKALKLAEDAAGPRNLTLRTAESVNAELLAKGFVDADKLPYLANTTVAEVKTVLPETKYVRVFTEGETSANGGWLTKLDEITNADGSLMSQDEIRRVLNLPPRADGSIRLPTHIIDVTLPPDVPIRIGKCSAIVEGGMEGSLQIQIDLPPSQRLDAWFDPTTIRSLPP
jgi:hypothetical protein